MRRVEWTPAGIAVVILAVTLGGGWATGLVMAASSRTPPITDTTSDLLLAVGGVLAGSVSTYIGGVLARRRGPPGIDAQTPDGETD